MKQTPLHSLHLELGAKMVPFAGYLLPIHYRQGIIDEHLHCRSTACFFDISHMGQYLISGESAADALQKLIPGDITGMTPGRQKYAVLTNEQGGIIDDIIVTRVNDGLHLVVNAACKDKDFGYLSERLGAGCHLIEWADRALVALQGPASDSVMRGLSAEAAALSFMHRCTTKIKGIPCRVSRCGYTGEDGFEISVAGDQAERLARLLLEQPDIAPAGLGARDTLRLEAGLCLYGHELTESVTPVEAGLSWLVKKGRSDYPGAVRINRQLQQGASTIRAGLAADGKLPVRDNTDLFDENGRIVGRVTSGSYAPSLGRPAAMAQIDRLHAAPGTRVFAKVRDHDTALTVAALPFIPHRYRR